MDRINPEFFDTDQSQSEVCEILQGRHVQNVTVLERIADGLGVPRDWLGVGYGQQTPEASPVGEVEGDGHRRALLATIATATLGEPLFDLG